jgi:hypothetical protein
VFARQNEKVEESLAHVRSRPHMVAATVSRYSSSQPVQLAATPSTPPSPDEDREPEDLLSLGRTVKRRKIGNQKPNVVVRMIRNPDLATGRLFSIKT